VGELHCCGRPDPDGLDEVYLITHDTDPADIAATALPMREVRYALEHTLKAERVVTLADTCHSAALVSGGRRLATPPICDQPVVAAGCRSQHDPCSQRQRLPVARRRVNDSIEAYNENAKPFVWTKAKVHQRRVKGRRISEL
jgi:hypothetical protein